MFMPGGFGGSLTQLLRFAPTGVGAGGTWTNTGPALPYATDYLADTAGANGTIYAIGGTNTYTTALPYVQTLLSGATSWTLAANLPTPRCDLGAAADATGLIYAIGGDNCAFSGGTYDLYDTNEIFNPTLGTWSEGPVLPNTVTLPATTVGPEGRIYVIGGWDGSADETSVQVYDPVSGYWIP
jgi:Kelch motif